MAPDERDRIFDQALARHLRSAAPAGEAAGIPASSAATGGVCPDSETLAAYHERSLLPEQLNSLKEHIVGCANCQTILAHLETTDEIPFEAAGREQIFAPAAATSIASAARQGLPPLPAALPAKSRRARLLRGARWQWLAPAGALAAGLLVWVALHENQHWPLPSGRQSDSKMAENKPPAPIPSGTTRVLEPPASRKPVPTLTLPQPAVDEKTISSGSMTSDAAQESHSLGGAAGTRSVNSLHDKEVSEGKDRSRDASADQLSAANRSDLGKNLPEALQKKQEVSPPASNVPAEIAPLQNSQTQNQSNNYPQQRVSGPNPATQTEIPRKAKATAAAATAPTAPPADPGAVGGVTSSYNGSASLKVAREIYNSRLISPPGSNVVWRAGRGGQIEFSEDGGSSWSRQASGVGVDLFSGSAPSDKVCWIVGRSGTVLRTTDGGLHWNLLPLPTKDDLGGVQASDALHAGVWNSLNTKNFETSDGGLTWTASPRP